MSLILSGDTSGAITVTVPAVAGTNTITLPAATGTVLVSGNQPAFSAYSNTAQSASSNTFTKIVFQVEDFDTNSNFASSTFTPTVAGYYQVNCSFVLEGSGTSTVQFIGALYKNGSAYQRLFDVNPSAAINSSSRTTNSGSIVVYCNGTTDYLEMYGYYYLGTCTFGGAVNNRFSASLVRAA